MTSSSIHKWAPLRLKKNIVRQRLTPGCCAGKELGRPLWRSRHREGAFLGQRGSWGTGSRSKEPRNRDSRAGPGLAGECVRYNGKMACTRAMLTLRAASKAGFLPFETLEENWSGRDRDWEWIYESLMNIFMFDEQNNKTENVVWTSRHITVLAPSSHHSAILFSSSFLSFSELFRQVLFILFYSILITDGVVHELLSVFQCYANLCKWIIMFLRSCILSYTQYQHVKFETKSQHKQHQDDWFL